MTKIEDQLKALKKLLLEKEAEIKSLKEVIRNAKDISPIKRVSRKRAEREAQSKCFRLKK